MTNPPASDVAFTPAVKAVQEARGSRAAYARAEARGGFERAVTAELADFLSVIETAFLATASADGQPYVQHRGGPPGFLRVLDDRTIGFADFTGNRQYISTGNLGENDRVCLIAVDYAHRRRVKLWGRARVVTGDAELLPRLAVPGYRARVEQAIVITVSAWDVNCPQHIPQLVDAAAVEQLVAGLRARIAELEAGR
jgi:predicted pyridoxine 5'-phosphate oxidase superfamily flavin-nucleotide-binding protein